jgi:3-isopropylmalate dehydrogenase
MAMNIAILEGDGIGPEICAAACKVLEAASDKYTLGLELIFADVGLKSLKRHGTTLTDQTFEIVQSSDGIVLGPVSHLDYPPIQEGGLNPSGVLRKRLDLFANIRPAKTRTELQAPLGKPFDLIIYRENTEGFYSDRNLHEGIGDLMVTSDVAISIRRVTRQASLRIAEAAFQAAVARGKKVTAVHKQNVLKVSDGLFLDCCREVAARFPDVIYDEILVDAACAHLVRTPEDFDVIVTTNMFGDIISDLTSELSGSLGLAPSINAGTQHAMAQAQHGSAPNIAGLGIANPSSLIGSVAMLLKWMGTQHGSSALIHASQSIDAALEQALMTAETRTSDLGGILTTEQFALTVAKNLA